ncbi:YceI family protein [Rhodocytophaga rosea]|uniref:YceI family protein n=1 Tax=Rhodocytophaga rosea TaxID=2704465 RepID=A0A6C0GBF3_9BACT|nr:YceI family protein [Rhodocytophaga rosea]QHT65208.1 YceI family protein [Rhodocytophaga rosea]
METQQFNIIGSQSLVEWVGRKVTGAHNGTIAIKEGTLTFKDNHLLSGRFVIDTRSIKILDITDPVTNAQFAGHLASDDFFSSEQYPEAIFEISYAEPINKGAYHVTGNLTIKGITQLISFNAQVDRSGNTVTASGKITVDRTKFGIKFRSGNFFQNLGDTLIYNNFDLGTHLTAQAATQPEVTAQPIHA